MSNGVPLLVAIFGAPTLIPKQLTKLTDRQTDKATFDHIATHRQGCQIFRDLKRKLPF
eukprot:COSAG06_NODE_51246_length_313_cov_0.962617_1_plen_57_part_10